VLSERVGKCDALVAVIGRDWISSDNQRRLADRHDFVRIEIAAALERNVRVIPVFVEGAGMPNREKLPHALQKFSRREGIDLSHANFDSDVRRLIRVLSSLAEENRQREESDRAIAEAARRADEAKRARKAHGTVGAVRQGVKTVNLALQSGGSLGACNDAYTWGVLDAFAEDARVEISAISGAGAGAMNGAVFAFAMDEGGRERARQRLEQFWRRVSDKGALSLDVLLASIDFARLRATKVPKLFVAATNIRSGRGMVFRGDFLIADHLMASACVPPSSQAVEIDGEAYWGGGYIGNPPLWPLFYETDCDDVVVVQINPFERIETPHTSEDISDRLTEITFNASLLAELRSADFVARLVKAGLLTSEDYRLSRLHRIGPPVDLAPTKNDVSWPLLNHARELGRADAKTWLEENFDAIGVESTLDSGRGVKREQTKQKRAPAS
jgi:NTE family protein